MLVTNILCAYKENQTTEENPLSRNRKWYLLKMSKSLLESFTLELKKCWASVILFSIFQGIPLRILLYFSNQVFEWKGRHIRCKKYIFHQLVLTSAVIHLMESPLATYNCDIFLRKKKMTSSLVFHRLFHRCDSSRDNLLSTTSTF